MTETGTHFQFSYRRSADEDRQVPVHHPVVVVGAGPVGLTMALDLASRGIACVLIDDADRIGQGSRGICYAKRTLEIWDRLGAAAPMLAKGVVWQKGRVFQGDAEVFNFDLLPEAGHKMPAFINLQQYYVEKFLVEAIGTREEIDLRWRNKLVSLERTTDGLIVGIETPEGPYRLACEWLVACDGARSTVRSLLGLEFEGEAFDDQFLIADVRMRAAFPSERWFWFQPPFHSGQSALLHKQPDDIWRIDLQLGPDADGEAERRPEVVIPRIARMLGHRDFELAWVSVYRFQCRRIARFVHGSVVFAGDAAHQVSPFGARGANSGVQDAENLAWKLALVLKGEALRALIDSYDVERGQAADDNIAHSTRSTDFIAPRTAAERRYRDAVLDLSRTADFAKRFVNSGRLSTPTVYASPLSTPDSDHFAGPARLGAPLPDVPLGNGRYLLEELRGFTVLYVPGGTAPPSVPGAELRMLGRDLADPEGLFARRLDATPGAAYLIRPDQHLAARWRRFDVAAIAAALARAHGRDLQGGQS
jgi:3-(3-hydroxy-phenyl)propionate hydroxylase